MAGAIVVGGLVALVVALSVCPGCFGQPVASPLPSGTHAAGASAAQIDAVISQMPAIRELEPLRDVPYQMVTRDQFKADLQTMFDDEVDLTVLAAQQRLYQRLGLLPAGADLRQLLLDLNGGAVAAYYRPDTGTFYVIDSDRPFGPLDRVYVAHEYTHALQDQHFDLQTTRITDPAEGDAALAQLAVIEGDASTAMMLWAAQNLTVAERLQMLAVSLNGTDQQTLDAMPPILSRQLTFPYGEGMSFVAALQQQGGWAAVNRAVQHPPPSTEQILHREKYDAQDVPIAMSLPDPSAALGGGWAQVDAETVGELSMQVFVAGGQQPSHAEAAAGWGGDRIYEWEGPDGAWAIGWISAWDTAGDADEFAARVGELKSGFSGPAQVDRADHNGVRLLVASDAATLSALATALH